MRAKANPPHSFLPLILIVSLFVSGCASYAGKATYEGSLSDVPARANPSDRYCVIEIREERRSDKELGQSPPVVTAVQSRLETSLPGWFSSGEEAVPVIVRSRSSVEYSPVGLLPGSWLTSVLCLCTLGIVPSYGNLSRMRFETELVAADGPCAPAVSYSATIWYLTAQKPILDAFWSRSAGWRRIAFVQPNDGSPLMVPDRVIRFDDDDGQKLDAFCASVARAVQKLTSEERESLRNNDEAWYLDAKKGNRRNRPVSIRKGAEPGAAKEPAGSVASDGRPRIVSQSWSAETRRGSLVLDLSGCGDRNAALAWARDEYLPDYCRVLGVAVSADDPASAPAATVRVLGFSTLEDGSVRIEFLVLE